MSFPCAAKDTQNEIYDTLWSKRYESQKFLIDSFIEAMSATGLKFNQRINVAYLLSTYLDDLFWNQNIKLLKEKIYLNELYEARGSRLIASGYLNDIKAGTYYNKYGVSTADLNDYLVDKYGKGISSRIETRLKHFNIFLDHVKTTDNFSWMDPFYSLDRNKLGDYMFKIEQILIDIIAKYVNIYELCKELKDNGSENIDIKNVSNTGYCITPTNVGVTYHFNRSNKDYKIICYSPNEHTPSVISESQFIRVLGNICSTENRILLPFHQIILGIIHHSSQKKSKKT